MSDPALDAHEHAEHAAHAAHESDPFISRVSITIAILAVLAAAAASLETFESASAIIAANQAVLAQEQATDQWNFYEAKSLKKNMYDIAAEAGGAKTSDYAKKAKVEGEGQDQAQGEAKAFEQQSDRALERSESHEQRHHRLTIAATLVEIGIAISTIAIITRKRWPWIGSVVLGVIGLAAGIWAYLP